jgi:hypothetical protein
MCTYGVRRVPTTKPSILSHNDVLTGGTIQMLSHGNIHMVPHVKMNDVTF